MRRECIILYEGSIMETIKLDLKNITSLKEKTALCLGYFDGLHLGHRTLIENALKENDHVAILTFDFSPKLYLAKKKNIILTSLEDKEKILEKVGVEYLLVLNIDEGILDLEKNDFISLVLAKLNPSHIYCGTDFRFGKNKEGKVDDLKKVFPITAIDTVDYEGKKISTSRIIDLLKRGDIDNANILLGRYYTVKGTVIKGLGNGKRIGFRTANLSLSDDYYLPKNGVYICQATDDKKTYPAICNVGVHPSLDELEKSIIEVHVLNRVLDLQGKVLKVELLRFLRSEKKFREINDLVLQIMKDILKAEDYFKK